MNHRIDDPQTTRRRLSPTHRAQPPLAAAKRRTRRSLTVISALTAAVAVPTALAVAGPSQPATSAGTAATGCVNTVNGIPPRGGGAYVGAAAGGSQTFPGLESKTAAPLREHRSYFSAGQVDGAVNVVRADLAAGRLPWISFHAPYTWAAMASGKGDAWAAALTRKLANVGGPVWIAFHHEPIESPDGTLQDWIRMQQRLAPIVHANSNNIAFSVIYSSWNVTYGSHRLSQVWPGAGVDILGIDIYNNYGVRSTKMMDPMKFIPIFQQWADGHGIRWAIAESGYTQAAASVDPTWLDTMFHDAVTNGAAAYTYFDSSKNTVADWTLDTATKINAFNRILSLSARIC
jgi:hypothetical protein